VAPAQRLSRAALYAFGVGSLAVVTSCGGSIAGESEGKTSSGDDAGHIADGAVDDSRVTARVDAQSSPDVTNFTVPYGVPPPFDAGLKVDANVEVGDADERPDVFCCIPVYGGPSGG
jgi:hypothetical protein